MSLGESEYEGCYGVGSISYNPWFGNQAVALGLNQQLILRSDMMGEMDMNDSPLD